MPNYTGELSIRQAMKRVSFFYSMTDEARKKIYGLDKAPEFATCAKGIGPYGCGVCKHPECLEYEVSLTIRRIAG